ncbi:beta-galactosidase [Fundicoccus sp. Sow4_H7]|uniref:beta-galactosidase n=1 Tax=Fundicoccus sp. Sow4_H7 TaxID=3438784 RepID=UPI003F8F2650
MILHGGDYFPEQWLHQPQVLDEDFELLKAANINTITVGMFAWSILEPEEGIFNFEWLDEVFDKAEVYGMKVILGTPSGARPHWLANKYPDVLRVNARNEKMLFGGRHNHCFTSPNYREKVRIINEKLAERYGQRDNLIMWHLSNEYSGDCHCDLCQAAFRDWMKEKYNNSLEAVNANYWNTFWSHTYTDWDQIHSPSQLGETAVHALNLDWRRFVTDQTIDFYLHEKAAVQKYSTNIPVTTNFMADTENLIPFQSLDYSKFSQIVDVLTWDCYPAWHNDWETEADLAMKIGFINDLYRSLKEAPFLIMESTPSFVNWHPINRSKRPKVHELASMQFLAHGSDSVMYFQMRSSKGSSEKFHGSVISHVPPARNRVYQEVQTLGAHLNELSDLTGAMKHAQVGIYYDWENDWVLQDIQGFSKSEMHYHRTLHEHYRPFWEADINVDIVTKNNDFDHYKLLIFPMLYMHSEELLAKVEAFVAGGGTVVYTYMSGMADENDLVHDDGMLVGLQELLGIRLLETDVYYPSQSNHLVTDSQSFTVHDYATVFEIAGATPLATYGDDFYRNTPSLTVNITADGDGRAYFIGARTELDFLRSFYADLVDELGIGGNSVSKSSAAVSVQTRTDADGAEYVFVMNFSDADQEVRLAENVVYVDALTKQEVSNIVDLPAFEVKVLKTES